MAPVTKDPNDFGFVISEANNFRSRETVVVDASGAALQSGTVLGIVTASGKYVRHDSDASNGSETEAGILAFAIGAEEAERVIIARDAEVNGGELIYENGANAAAITASNTALASLNIIVR